MLRQGIWESAEPFVNLIGCPVGVSIDKTDGVGIWEICQRWTRIDDGVCRGLWVGTGITRGFSFTCVLT